MDKLLSDAQFEALASLSTPTVANAIETFKVRLRTEGYANGTIINRLPKPLPMLGYAVTMKMRMDGPPTKGMSYPDRSDWWDTVASLPNPKVLVIQDEDKPAGIGSTAGEIHGAIFRALGCIGIVTNGAVRDLEALDAMHMHVFSGSLCPSHAYAHIVNIGMPVEIGGLTIESGDLLHGDRHGLVNIPRSIAPEIHIAALKILQHERNVIQLCTSPDFSIDKLRRTVATINKLNTGED